MFEVRRVLSGRIPLAVKQAQLSFSHIPPLSYLSPFPPTGLIFVLALLLCPPSVLSTFCCLFLSLGLCAVMPHFVKIKILFLLPHGLVFCVQVYLAMLFPDLLPCLFPDRVDSLCLSVLRTHIKTAPTCFSSFRPHPLLPRAVPLSWSCRGSGTHSLPLTDDFPNGI